MIAIIVVLITVLCVPAHGGPMTYINEFPHPRVVVHYHPTAEQFSLDDVEFALGKGVHAIEVDVHYRPSDGMIVCNHDKVTAESPALDQVIELILRKKGDSPSVNGDGLQFFLVIEPKENSPVLFDGVARVLSRYVRSLSTGAVKGGRPRGITVVITGAYPRQFYSHFPPEMVNRLCIAETHDYAGEISSLSSTETCFQWISLRWGVEKSRVYDLQHGVDTRLQGRFKVRIWDGHANMDKCLAFGADSVNADRDEIDTLNELIGSHHPAR
jgi:hypothetical protein